MAGDNGMTLESTLAQLATLWSDERCTVELQFIPAWSGNDAEHAVALEWTDDTGWLEPTCTYQTFRWIFDGDTFAASAALALAWATDLAVFKRCDECDGKGEWNDGPCSSCKATGLASEVTYKEPF